jgi:NADPH-dependent curcumin reductase CurA
MTGMVVFDWASRYAEGTQQLAQWFKEGKLIAKEDVVQGGVDAFPETLLKLFSGENFGKLVLAL